MKFDIKAKDECLCNECSCYSTADSTKILDLINVLPSYVLRMSQDVKGLVESSINMGIIKFCCKGEDNHIIMLARSSINSFLPAINAKLASMCRLAGFPYEGFKDAYGGWAPNVNSPLLKATVKNYALALKMKEEEIKVEAIHAGLECGELISKYP